MRRVLVWFGLVSVMVGVVTPATANPRGDGIKILRIVFDPPGVDSATNDSLNSEVVLIANKGSTLVTLTGWTLRDSDGNAFRFPSLSLAAEEIVKVHTGSGVDTARSLYWDAGHQVWNNNGDSATLRLRGGRIVHGCGYSGPGSVARCL